MSSIAVHRNASPARKKPGRCQTMDERAGSVGVLRPSLSALQQRDCRQGLNLQEVYRVLTSRRMSLHRAWPLLSRLLRSRYNSLHNRVLFCQSRYSRFFFLVRQVARLSWVLDRLGSSRIASWYSVIAWSSLRCSSKTFP